MTVPYFTQTSHSKRSGLSKHNSVQTQSCFTWIIKVLRENVLFITGQKRCHHAIQEISSDLHTVVSKSRYIMLNNETTVHWRHVLMLTVLFMFSSELEVSVSSWILTHEASVHWTSTSVVKQSDANTCNNKIHLDKQPLVYGLFKKWPINSQSSLEPPLAQQIKPVFS